VLSRSSVRAYALLWALGGAFLWWPWTMARAAVAAPHGERPPVALTVTTGLLALSLTLAAIFRPDPFRVVAAVANLTVWVTLLLWSAHRPSSSDVDGLLRGILDLAVIQAVLALAAFTIYPTLSGFELPLARVLPDSVRAEPNVAALSTVRLAYPDYFGGDVLRTAGLFGNATWAGGLAGLGLLIVVFGAERLSPAMQRPPVRAVVAVLCAVSLYLSYARVDVLAVIAAAMAIWAVRKKHLLSLRVCLGSACLVLAALIALSPEVPVQRWIDKLNEPRRGSLESRSEIYRRTIERTAEAPVPLVGAGIKERETGLVASVGSHSTYLGLAYRGGLLAAVTFLVFLGALLHRAWRRVGTMAAGLTVFIVVWCATDDLDAGNLMPLGLLAAFWLAHEPGSEPPQKEPGGGTVHVSEGRLSP
jgi:hypothetical protein